jgi:CheY-like chemotaxis protein
MNGYETRTILLIEDNPMEVDLTCRAFGQRRISNPVEVARDGAEALECIRRWETGAQPPILILLDLNLPRVDGLEILRQLKSHPEYSMIPVVILTTSAEDADVKTSYALGANSCIVKPVDFDRFTHIADQIELYWTILNKNPGKS